MLSVPEKLKSITHPLVASMYLKKDYGSEHEDVLVIETNQRQATDASSDIYLMELLNDLYDLQQQAEGQIGKFDRVDICSRSRKTNRII